MPDIKGTIINAVENKLDSGEMPLNGFFSEDKLKMLLGPDGFKTLANAELDATRNFLSGQITSPLKKLQNNKTFAYSLSATTKVAGAALQSYTFLKNAIQDISGGMIQRVISDLTNAAVKGVMQRGASLVEKNVRTLIALPTIDDLQKDITSYFFAYRTSLSDVLTKRKQDDDDEVTRDNEERKKSKFSMFMDKVSYRVTKIAYGTNQIMDKAEPYINSVISYYEMGPAWLSNQMNNELDMVENMLCYYIDPWVKNINEKKEEFIKTQVEKAAQKLVEKYNKTIEKEADKILSKTNKLKVKGVLKANMSIASAKTKITELVPIPIQMPKIDVLSASMKLVSVKK